jgi:hypothetical protein
MSISREKRLRRAELFEIHKIRCRQHRAPNCPEGRCRTAAAAEFYGRGKKARNVQVRASSLDLDQLFYLINHPQAAEKYFLSVPEGLDSLPPVHQAPTPIISPTVSDPRRQRIELAKTAA